MKNEPLPNDIIKFLSDPESFLRRYCENINVTTGVSIFYYRDELQEISCQSQWTNHMKNFFLFNCPYDPGELVLAGKEEPFTYTDSLMLNWLIIPDVWNKAFFIMGPTFDTDFDVRILQKRLAYQEMSVSSRIQFSKMTDDIPVVPKLQLFQYGSMLYHAIYRKKIVNIVIRNSDLSERTETGKSTHVEKQFISQSHGSRYIEKMMLYNVRNGISFNLAELSKDKIPLVGSLSNNDILRQNKNMGICQITLVTRAAVDGGVNADQAYSYSDYCIQKLETMDAPDQILLLLQESVDTFTRMVQEVQQKDYSGIVKYILSYIDSHVSENISLTELAGSLGYDTYYLTNRFHKETGSTIKNYILERKIDQAKLLLTTSIMDVSEISDSLSFSTPAYFSNQFKKVTGLTPLAYREKV